MAWWGRQNILFVEVYLQSGFFCAVVTKEVRVSLCCSLSKDFNAASYLESKDLVRMSNKFSQSLHLKSFCLPAVGSACHAFSCEHRQKKLKEKLISE